MGWRQPARAAPRPKHCVRHSPPAKDALTASGLTNAYIDEHGGAQQTAQEFIAARKELNWNGLYFGGVAFKHQRLVADEDLGTAAAAAQPFMDVVCTSGPGTGQAAQIDKAIAMRDGLPPNAPLALASGVTAHNIASYLPYVNAFLIGTGIEKEFGVFDSNKLSSIMGIVRRRPPNLTPMQYSVPPAQTLSLAPVIWPNPRDSAPDPSWSPDDFAREAKAWHRAYWERRSRYNTYQVEKRHHERRIERDLTHRTTAMALIQLYSAVSRARQALQGPEFGAPTPAWKDAYDDATLRELATTIRWAFIDLGFLVPDNNQSTPPAPDRQCWTSKLRCDGEQNDMLVARIVLTPDSRIVAVDVLPTGSKYIEESLLHMPGYTKLPPNAGHPFLVELSQHYNDYRRVSPPKCMPIDEALSEHPRNLYKRLEVVTKL